MSFLQTLGYKAENQANKDTDGTMAANSDVKYPSQKAAKTYIDNASSNASVIGKLLTGFSAGAGTVSASDTILQAFNKVVGNIGNKQDADADLTAIAGLSPVDNDIIQRKSGAWTNRTPTQFAADINLVPPANTITLVAASPYTLTIPASMTVAGRDVANTFTRQQFIDGGADEIQLRVRANATQTANLLELLPNASLTPLAYFSSVGSLRIQTATTILATLINTEPSGSSTGAYISLYERDGAPLVSGDRLGGFIMGGSRNISNTTNNSVAFSAFAIETWSDTQAGARCTFEVCPSGSINRTVIAGIYGNGLVLGTTTSAPTGLLQLNGIANATQLIVKANATQTSNLVNFENSSGTVQLAIAGNGRDFILDATTGSKIGTATSQKLGFWNAAPIVQPTTGVTAATIVGGAGTTVKEDHTFDGYTIAQVVKALRNTGLLA